MSVRRASVDDLPAVVAIYNHAVEHTVATFDVDPVTLADRREWFRQFDDRHPLFVSESPTGVDGFAYYLPFRPKAAYALTKECTIYVASDRHGRGVGTALYAALIEHARAAGVHVLVGVLGGENPASTQLHRRFGFEQVGHLREVGHKHGHFVDTYYFEKVLG